MLPFLTPGSRFQTILNVLIPYDIYPISLAKPGFDKGRNDFSAYPANVYSTPGFIMLTIAAASMMIVLIPVGILLCRLTSAWRHSTSSDFFLEDAVSRDWTEMERNLGFHV